MTDPKAYDWAEIGKAHAINARRIEAMLPELEAVSRVLHVERITAEAHAAAVGQRAKLAADALSTAHQHLGASHAILRAQGGGTDALALEYLLGHRTDDDALKAAKARGLVTVDGAQSRRGIDILFALNTTITNKDA